MKSLLERQIAFVQCLMVNGTICLWSFTMLVANAGGLGQSDWAPPIGVPDPMFGIRASSSPDSPADPNAYDPSRDYWIDNSHPNCTDSNNPRGSPNRPRRTIPKNLTLLREGTLVQIRGGITHPYELNDIGTPDDNTANDGIIRVSGDGTANAPIWIRGPRNGPYPQIRSSSPSTYWTWVTNSCTGVQTWRSKANSKYSMFKIVPVKVNPNESKPSSHIYFENLALVNVRFDIDGDTTASNSTMGIHHVMIRRVQGHGVPPPAPNLQPPTGATTQLYQDTSLGSFIRLNRCSNVVVYDCDIYENGAYARLRPYPEPDPYDFENDYYGVMVGLGSFNIWVVDNRMYSNSGDSIQVNITGALSGGTWNSNPANANAHHIYIGRNEMHHEREEAVDLKLCHHVVVSQNKLYAFKPITRSGGGTAIVIHSVPVSRNCDGTPVTSYPYERRGPDHIWVLYNEIYDCERSGITVSHSVNEDTSPNEIYLIGNLIYNVKHRFVDANQDGLDDWIPDPASAGLAIGVIACSSVYAYHNTIYDCDLGIAVGSRARDDSQSYRVDIANNIITKMSSHEGYFHLGFLNYASATDSLVKNNLFYEPDERVSIILVQDPSGKGDHYEILKFESVFSYMSNKSGNLWVNPLFAHPFSDPLLRDFRLLPGSPAIDSGLDLGFQELFSSIRHFQREGILLNEDFGRNPRPSGSAFDRGAYEFIPHPE